MIDNQLVNEYNADSIKILDHDEAIERWFWAKAGELATQYSRPEEWVSRGLQACERAGVHHNFFIDKYLKKLPLPKHDGVTEAMREILLEERDAQSIQDNDSRRAKNHR